MRAICLLTGKRGSQSAPNDGVLPQQDTRLAAVEKLPMATTSIIKSGGAHIPAVATMSNEPSISNKTDSAASANRGKGERYFSS